MSTEPPVEALESLLRSRVVASYVESIIEEALAPRRARLTPAQTTALRAYLYDQLTSDPLLRGLISRIGRALKQRKPRSRRRPALPRSSGAG